MNYRLRKLALSRDDLRDLKIESTKEVSSEFDDMRDDYGVTSMNNHIISILKNGDNIAEMRFFDIENVPFEVLMETSNPNIDTIDRAVYVTDVFVKEEYRNYGLGYKLYEEFGKIYNQNFDGWPVARYFINPVAEYSFRKAVANGLISEHSLSEDYINTSYKKQVNDYDASVLWKDLRQKLPEKYRGN